MTRHPPLSADDKAKIIHLYTVEQLGTDKIGLMFGRTGDTIRNYLVRWGVKRRPPGNPSNGKRLTPADKAEIVQLYTVKGLSTEAIGNRIGCEDTTVWYWLKRLGVTLRLPGNPRANTSNARTLRMTGIRTQASIAAATFVQPSLIQLPPHLQAEFEACVAEVRSERGSNPCRL